VNSQNLILDRRVFDIESQILFAKISGDCNPVHVDQLQARRTVVGQCIVHGVHAVLWALESCAFLKIPCFSEIDVSFLKPIYLNEEIICIWDQEKQQLILSGDGVVLVRIKTKTETFSRRVFGAVERASPASTPENNTFFDCEQQVNRLFQVHSDDEGLRDLFPNVAATYGFEVLCELAELSYLVGMECPGLYSLFGGFNVAFSVSEHECPQYSVVNSDPRFSSLTVKVLARNFQGEVQAFYRPPPVKNPSIIEIVPYVNKGEFSKTHALIIGGSRGLGELVAKVIGAGGGSSLITYNTGRDEAKAVADEISAYGSFSETCQFAAGASADFRVELDGITQVYYFASPKILGKRSTKFDLNQRSLFMAAYVQAFELTLRYLVGMGLSPTIFYPSTIFIDKPQKDFEYYVEAKKQGELKCDQLSRELNLKILSLRLPKLNTDQTQAMFSKECESGVDAMLQVVRKMNTLQNQQSNLL
jgi:acyl dehydratase